MPNVSANDFPCCNTNADSPMRTIGIDYIIFSQANSASYASFTFAYAKAKWHGSFIGLECVSSGTIRKFEWIFRQFKEEIRRLSSAKSRIDDAEMA